MARKPMVTRTITTTKVNVLCLDVNTEEVCNKFIVLPRTYTNNKKLMSAVVEEVNKDGIKAVHIVSVDVVETLYGMSEQDFMNHATKLNALRQPIEDTEPTENTEEV